MNKDKIKKNTKKGFSKFMYGDKLIAGNCGKLAERIGLTAPGIIRIAFAFLTFQMVIPGLVAYILTGYVLSKMRPLSNGPQGSDDD